MWTGYFADNTVKFVVGGLGYYYLVVGEEIFYFWFYFVFAFVLGLDGYETLEDRVFLGEQEKKIKANQKTLEDSV